MTNNTFTPDVLSQDDAAVLTDALSVIEAYANDYGNMGVDTRTIVRADIAKNTLSQFIISLAVWDGSTNAQTILDYDKDAS